MTMRLNTCCLFLLSALVAGTANGASPATPSASCGNGLLEAGETCGKCAEDCAVSECDSGPKKTTFAVMLNAPEANPASTAALRVAYRNRIVTLPGHGSDPALRGRVRGAAGNSAPIYNDLDYAIRLVLARPKELMPGEQLTIEFDGCKGARAPTAADFACVVEACANATGPVSGCECSVLEKRS